MKVSLILPVLAGVSLAAPTDQDWSKIANEVRSKFGLKGLDYNLNGSPAAGGHLAPWETVYKTLFSPTNTSQQTKDALDGRSIAPLFELPYGWSEILIQPVFPVFFKLLELAYFQHYISPTDVPLVPLNDTGISPSPSNGWIYSPGRVAINPRWDSFYRPDSAQYSGLALGQVIAFRQVGFASSWDQWQRGWQISYRSTFGDGTTPSAEITTVIEPKNNDQRHAILLGYEEDASGLESAPSYTLAAGTTSNVFDQFVNKGWVTVIPDHEGINAAFGHLQHAYRAYLDGGKAYNNFKGQVGLRNSEFILWGYSGGSTPLGGAIEHCADYAPELDIKAAFTGGLLANIQTVGDNLNGGLAAGFLAEVITSFMNELSSVRDALTPLFKTTALRERLQQVTVNGQGFYYALINYCGQDIFNSYFTTGSSEFWNVPVIKSLVADNRFGLAKPQVPVFVYNSINDELIPISLQDEVVDTWCKKGGSVNYYRTATVEHALLLYTTEGMIPDIMDQVFAGTYKFAGCNSWADATRSPN